MNRASYWYSLAMPFSHKLNCFTLPLPDKKKQMLNSAKQKLIKKEKMFESMSNQETFCQRQ